MDRPWPPEQEPWILSVKPLKRGLFGTYAGERNIGARVDGKAVILVLDNGARDVNTGRRANVKGISVVSTTSITSRVVHVHIGNVEVVGTVDGHELNRSVLDVQVLDVRVGETVGVKGLWLGLSAVGSLAVPVSSAAKVDYSASGTLDGDSSSGDGYQWTCPLLVTKGGSALECNDRVGLETGQVESRTGWHHDAIENDVGAGSLAADSSCSRGEGARAGSRIGARLVGLVACSRCSRGESSAGHDGTEDSVADHDER